METPIILCERLTPEEEVDFLQAVNQAVEDGELTDEEASAIIDREYELLASMAR